MGEVGRYFSRPLQEEPSGTLSVSTLFYRYPDWAGAIIHHYWHLRFARGFDQARIRKQYRRLEAEKKRLADAGVDSEAVRLLCRHMVNTRNKAAEERWWNYYFSTLQTNLEGV